MDHPITYTNSGVPHAVTVVTSYNNTNSGVPHAVAVVTSYNNNNSGVPHAVTVVCRNMLNLRLGERGITTHMKSGEYKMASSHANTCICTQVFRHVHCILVYTVVSH